MGPMRINLTSRRAPKREAFSPRLLQLHGGRGGLFPPLGGFAEQDAEHVFIERKAAAERGQVSRLALENDVHVKARGVFFVRDARKSALIHLLDGLDFAARLSD